MLRSLAPPVYIPTVLESAGETALIPVIPLLALDLGFSTPQAAALMVIFGISSVLGPIPAGILMSRIGGRRAIVAAGILLILANLFALVVVGQGLAGTPDATHRLGLVALLVVMAASTQVWALGRQSYLGTALPATMRARGMTLFGGMHRIGQVIGPLLGAVVISVGSERWVFGLFAVMTTLATIMVAVFMVPGEEKAAAPGAVSRAARSDRPAVRRDRPAVRGDRTAARSRLDRAVIARMMRVALGVIPLVMARINRPVIVSLIGAGLGLDATQISIIFGISAILDIALVVPAGIVMDRFGRAAVAVPCALGIGAGFVLLAVLVPTYAATSDRAAFLSLLLASLLIALGNGLGSGIVMTLGIDTSPVHGRTRYLSWWNTLIGGGRLIAPLTVTAVALVAPVAVSAAVLGGLCLISAAYLSRILPELTPSGGTRSR